MSRESLINSHLISSDESVKSALQKLDDLAVDSVLFVVDIEKVLLGSLTDGDLRRGFLNGLGFSNPILDFANQKPAYLLEKHISLEVLDEFKSKNYKIVPVVNEEKKITDVINFRLQSTVIPVDVLLMAGGEGRRLRPLTDSVPKPLLKVGNKPIIEHNIDRLISVGVKNINISINYLGDQLVDYFQDGSQKGVSIDYIRESKPLGTIGSILLMDHIFHDDIIVMNSDLLTDIDFKDFYQTYKTSGADMAVAATSYTVDVPYAVLETDSEFKIKSLKEKPRYTYYSNAGIYILNKKLLPLIPSGSFFDITDLMQRALELKYQIVTYPINGYWLDIGRHEDFTKAQEDIKHIKL